MSIPRPLLLLVPALLTIVAALASGSQAHVRKPVEPPFAPAPPPAVAVHRSFRVDRPSACTQHGGDAAAYPWPIAPFHEQHPIRGYFGDPRTVFRGPNDPDQGAFSFHNGVDIVAPAGTPVYPVLSGIVTQVRVDEVVVLSDDGHRIFQYWHVVPSVEVNDRVEVERTVLGVTARPFRHVHLTEIDHSAAANPLQPGHLTPYADATPPFVESLYLRGPTGAELAPAAVKGSIELITRALDTPALPVPEPWTGLPVSPALVGFELTTPNGRVVLPEETPVNFEHTEPPNSMFWDLYAAGTFQNFPAVGKHLFRGAAGEYLYELTPDRLDTAALRPGPYVVTVIARDTCGNEGTLSEAIRVLPQGHRVTRTASRSLDEPQPSSLAPWPRGHQKAWTVVIASIGTRQGIGAATEAARLASAAGLPQMDVVDSRRLAGFRPGSFVVFSGFYRTAGDAQDALTRTTALYPEARVRELVRRGHRR